MVMVRPIAGLTAKEIEARAAEFRQMAGSSAHAAVRDTLLRLAEYYEFLAEAKPPPRRRVRQ